MADGKFRKHNVEEVIFEPYLYNKLDFSRKKSIIRKRYHLSVLTEGKSACASK